MSRVVTFGNPMVVFEQPSGQLVNVSSVISTCKRRVRSVVALGAGKTTLFECWAACSSTAGQVRWVTIGDRAAPSAMVFSRNRCSLVCTSRRSGIRLVP